MISAAAEPVGGLRRENDLLLEQVRDLKETIRAIREGEVDALIVEENGDQKVFTLKGADHVYQEVVEGMSEGALTFDSDGMILYCNQFFADMVGRPVRDVVGSSVHDHFLLDLTAGLASLMVEAKTRRTRGEIFLKHAAGREMPTLLSMRQLDVEGLSVFCGVVTDMTVTRENEDARVRTAELLRANLELNQFAYVSSHDLQEPLRKIRTYSELLESRFRGQMGETGDKYLRNITESTSRMQLLITSLLSYSQLGEKPGPQVHVDLELLAGQVLSDLEIAIREADAVITVSDLPVIIGDPVRLRQLVQNLVSNALKFRGSLRPEIRISSTREEGEWVVSVQDNGIGIERTYFDHIFKVFNRLHLRSAFDGAGIGLAICKKITELHGGRIWVTSIPGSGSTFSFSIPV